MALERVATLEGQLATTTQEVSNAYLCAEFLCVCVCLCVSLMVSKTSAQSLECLECDRIYNLRITLCESLLNPLFIYIKHLCIDV